MATVGATKPMIKTGLNLRADSAESKVCELVSSVKTPLDDFFCLELKKLKDIKTPLIKKFNNPLGDCFGTQSSQAIQLLYKLVAGPFHIQID